MIVGFTTISIAFIAAVVAVIAYVFYHRDRTPEMLQLANRSFYLMSIGILGAVALLMYFIMTHHFEFNYVYSYSSRSLRWDYLMATFWAGQEGTFLLWLFYGVIFGFILIRKVSREWPLALAFLTAVQAFILLILLKRSPFAMVWHVHQDVPVGFVPSDGAGLNPLLINPWMRIHPPTLFLGYSSTMVLFAFAMAALINRDFTGWITKARPWIIFSVMVLGAGIILGGYWAYATLGWGGYWGWDPVENASLVPWLATAALLHGILIQRKRNALVKTNLFLAGFAFIMVLWGSFLTRSGVLTDFSVHSFAESGLNIYLITMVTFFAALFLVMFFKYARNIVTESFLENGIWTRETFIFAGLMALLLTAIFVFIATSAPIYTSLFGKPSNVSPHYYNQIIVPIAAIILLTVGFAPLMGWKISRFRFSKDMMISIGAAVVLTPIAIVLGMTDGRSILLFALAIFAIVANGSYTYRLLRKNAPKAGPYLTHVGLAFMVIGIVTSSIFDRHEKVNLPQGIFQKTSLGYELKFEGFVPQPDGRNRVKLRVRTPNGEYDAYPMFYFSNYTNSYMASPDVRSGLLKDIYIAPISFSPARASSEQELNLGQNETKEYGNFKIEFTRFDVNMKPDEQVVKANLKIQVNESNYTKEYHIAPAIYIRQGNMQKEEVTIPGTNYKVYLKAVDASNKRIHLAIKKPASDATAGRDIFAVEVREKPLIAILWFGAFVLIGGIALTLWDRFRSP